MWNRNGNSEYFGVELFFIEYKEKVIVNSLKMLVAMIDDIIQSLLDKPHSFANWFAQQKKDIDKRMMNINSE